MMAATAKLFTNGRSQAVRLPREFRFEGKEVFIRRDPLSGEVILSPKSGWPAFFDLVDATPVDERRDFLLSRRDEGPGRGDPFD